jgi:hypothetical protein
MHRHMNVKYQWTVWSNLLLRQVKAHSEDCYADYSTIAKLFFHK